MNGLGVSSDHAYLLPGDAASLLGLEPSRTPFDVWLAKKGKEVLVGGLPFFNRVLEPLIAEFYERDHSCELLDASEKVFFHSAYSFIAAQPAWLRPDCKTGVEIVSVPGRFEEEWGKLGTDEIPERWRLHAILSMAVLDYDRWEFAVSIDNEYPVYFLVERSSFSEQFVLQALQRWWEAYIVGDQEPDPGSSSIAREYLQERFPTALQPLQFADAGIEKIGAELAAILSHIAAFEKRRLSLENLLKLKMGSTEAVVGEFGKVRWKRSQPSSCVDWQRLAEALLSAHYAGREHELVAAFSVLTSTSREFQFVSRRQKHSAPSSQPTKVAAAPTT